MKPTIIELINRDRNTRKKKKEDADKIITLSTSIEEGSVSNMKSVRLLDEGTFMNADGTIDFIVKKGTLKNFYENLNDDYVGYINFAHMNVNSSPLYLGTWSKKDLNLIEKEDGRYALNVNPHFWTELSIVKDLLAMQDRGIQLSISAEMYASLDEQSSKTVSEQMNQYVSVYDELFIRGFSVVGNPRNPESTITLNKGDEDMTIKELLNKLSQDNNEEQLSEDNVEETTEEPVEETVEEETEEQVEETTEDETEEVQANEEDEIEASEDESSDSDDVKKIDALFSQLKQSNDEKDERIKELEAQLLETKKENKKLNARIDTNFKRLEQLVNNSAKEKKEPKKDSVWG